jgi:dTDP-4-amino-4,6-dideoxygalactose transaminase
MISLLDLTEQYQSIEDDINAAIKDVLLSGKFILGPNVQAFEKEICEYLGVEYAVGVASGTDALIIALRALGIGPGDQVIIPAYSFFATAGSVLTVGAEPVFVDVQPGTFLIDVQQISKVITEKTKAIIPVHLYGQPADMDEILKIAQVNHLSVIEDNAQAIGAAYKGKKTGTLGDIGCLSFFPTKNLGGYGDGGMLVCHDPVLAERIKMLRTHGWKKKYYPEELGYNSRLDELQAAVLRVKLKHLDAWNKKRREIADRYYNALKDIRGIDLPMVLSEREHVYHLFVLQAAGRDKLKALLTEAGIASDVYYPQPLHLAKPCQKYGYRAGDFPVSERASQSTLAIPLYPEMVKEQIDKVIEVVKSNLE